MFSFETAFGTSQTALIQELPKVKMDSRLVTLLVRQQAGRHLGQNFPGLEHLIYICMIFDLFLL